MTTLLLIRHGENEYIVQGRLAGRIPGVHLNAHGREQAAALAQALADAPIAAIYASPLERAAETAEIIAARLGLTVQIRPGLIEPDVGEWQGRSIKDLRRTKLWKLIETEPSRTRFPGGESFIELQKRLVAEIEAILSTHKSKDILAIVFHADPIRIVVTHYLGLPLDNFQRLAVSTGSVTLLETNEKAVKLHGLSLKPPFELPKRR